MKEKEYEGTWFENSDDEENFDWCDLKKKEDNENTYFIFVNNDRRTIQPGEQVFFSYGRRNN